MSSKNDWENLSIGEIRERTKHLPKAPIYDAIDLVIEDLSPFVKDNFNSSKNIYELGPQIFIYLNAFCKNFLDYFKDDSLIINYGKGPIKVKIRDIPGDVDTYINKKYFEPNGAIVFSDTLNTVSIINDSLIFLRDLNGEVSGEFIRNYFIKTYNIKESDLPREPVYKSPIEINRRRLGCISFKDEIPYGPIHIKNTNKEYNLVFFKRAMDELSEMLYIPEELKNRMYNNLISEENIKRFNDIITPLRGKNRREVKNREYSQEDLDYMVANAIGRFFFYSGDRDKNSKYMKIREELKPYYLNYLSKRKNAA